MPAKPDPWEQQPSESDNAFRAAKTYFSLGPNRKVEDVAARHGKSKDWYFKLCRKHDWVERAAAYDAQQIRLQIGELEEQARARMRAWTRRAEDQLELDWDITQKLYAGVSALLRPRLGSEVDPETGLPVQIPPEPRDLTAAAAVFEKANRLAWETYCRAVPAARRKALEEPQGGDAVTKAAIEIAETELLEWQTHQRAQLLSIPVTPPEDATASSDLAETA